MTSTLASDTSIKPEDVAETVVFAASQENAVVSESDPQWQANPIRIIATYSWC